MAAPSVGPFLAARVRVTLDCPECASPIPVNGIVDEVLCGACQAVVDVERAFGWDTILTYTAGEACMEHKVLMRSAPRPAMIYFLGFGARGGALYRKWRGRLVEIDTGPVHCPSCNHALDMEALGREAVTEGAAVDAFCPGCGGRVPIRSPSPRERELVHPECVAVVGETAPRGRLEEPGGGEKVLFSCLGCGAPSSVDATTPRIMKCAFCSATSYLPDALWLRLHPTQRKRAFHLLLRATPAVLAHARKVLDE